jgi:hypothetical protein
VSEHPRASGSCGSDVATAHRALREPAGASIDVTLQELGGMAAAGPDAVGEQRILPLRCSHDSRGALFWRARLRGSVCVCVPADRPRARGVSGVAWCTPGPLIGVLSPGPSGSRQQCLGMHTDWPSSARRPAIGRCPQRVCCPSCQGSKSANQQILRVDIDRASCSALQAHAETQWWGSALAGGNAA